MAPLTPEWLRENAINVARQLGNNYVGTEHLLLGLLMVDDGVGAEVLKALGVDFDKARDATFEMLSYTNKQEHAYTVTASGTHYTLSLGTFPTQHEADAAGRKFMADNENFLAVTVSYKIERKEDANG